ncbi:MAG: helicase C-terminal domain-containing protein [Opitutaceae bacterium]|jgi:Rad3-related DNA helicase
MQFDLDQRSASLSVGEFADFVLGPRELSGGASGIWRAQLGSHWHRQLQGKTIQEETCATFEVVIQGRVFHKGWTLGLSGRIDQMIVRKERRILREIKTVLRTLPSDESELRSEYPSYFLQLASYAALLRLDAATASPIASPSALSAELMFVEADSGLSQTVLLGFGDESLFQAQLDRVTAFLKQRLQARERLRQLSFRPPFDRFRPGQENALESLSAALHSAHSALLFEAPTGFGKTGIMLEAALCQMREGHFERLIYLTSKATGQIQVMSTISAMCGEKAKCVPSEEPADAQDAMPLSAWLVRPKSEHCINPVFHCVRDVCAHIRDVAARWERSGLSFFTVDPKAPRDIASLRAAGAEAGICPYEITRAALPFADVWIGDINYVFSPSARGLFVEQLGFLPGRTLLIVDEAHNLPARVADAYSHRFTREESLELRDALHGIRAPQTLVQEIEHLGHFLQHLAQHGALPLDDEDDARHLLEQAALRISTTPLDYAGLSAHAAELLWSIPSIVDELKSQPRLQRHWWSPRPGTLAVTCIDAASAIAESLREFGGVLLSSATFGPHDAFAESIGLADPVPELSPTSLRDLPLQVKAALEAEAPAARSPSGPTPGKLGKLTKRETKKLFARVTSGAELLRVEEVRSSAAVTGIFAGAPWRDGAYDVAVDLRVDTTFQHRGRFFALTAATLADWHRIAGESQRICAAFFPSYAYAESILGELEARGRPLRVSMQPRRADLAKQTEWVETALGNSDVLFLVLGSSFAESIDVLGGRVTRAMVVGPALPEVNPIQHARMAALAKLGREASFRRVYQIPGMQKANQALGRLVRAPGQKAKVLLHCRRFADPGYRNLLSPEYQGGKEIATDGELMDWMAAIL